MNPEELKRRVIDAMERFNAKAKDERLDPKPRRRKVRKRSTAKPRAPGDVFDEEQE